jgi:hypothetical protein
MSVCSGRTVYDDDVARALEEVEETNRETERALTAALTVKENIEKPLPYFPPPQQLTDHTKWAVYSSEVLRYCAVEGRRIHVEGLRFDIEGLRFAAERLQYAAEKLRIANREAESQGRKEQSEREVENCKKELAIWQKKVEKAEKNGKKRRTLRKRKGASEREAADTGLRQAWEELKIAEEVADADTQQYNKIMLAYAHRSAIEKLQYGLRSVASAVAASSPHSVDPWAKTTLSTVSNTSKGLRKQGADRYSFCETKDGGVIIAKCLLTGVKGDWKKVVTAQLLPSNTSDRILEELGVNSVDDMRNLIFLCYNIQQAFENRNLCFLAVDDRPGCFRLKIWSGQAKRAPLFDGSKQTIGEFDGQLMCFEEGKLPYTRVMSEHAQKSYFHALSQGWIGTGVPRPAEYGTPLKQDTIYFHETSTDTTSALSDEWNKGPEEHPFTR